MTNRNIITTSGQEVKMASAVTNEKLVQETFSLCPAGPLKRLRRLYRLRMKRIKYGHGNKFVRASYIRNLNTFKKLQSESMTYSLKCTNLSANGPQKAYFRIDSFRSTEDF